MSHANVEVVERFEDAFVRGDMDEVLSLLTPDIVVHEAQSLPYPGDHRGHDGFIRLADAFNSVWEIVSDLDLAFLDAGEAHVVVLVAFDVVTRQTGVPLRLRLVEVYTVRDGRIAELDVYYRDTAAIVEATGGARVL
jgi:ketosteroid isomerase-like protein